jgi:hypothetical protein
MKELFENCVEGEYISPFHLKSLVNNINNRKFKFPKLNSKSVISTS